MTNQGNTPHFVKKVRRPWDSDAEPEVSIPIMPDMHLSTQEKSLHDKGRMLIGGFFKPEGLVSDADHLFSEPILKKPTLADNLQSLLDEIDIASTHCETTEPETRSTLLSATDSIVSLDLSNTESLIETVIRAKQIEVDRLAQASQESLKQANQRLKSLEAMKAKEMRQRVETEDKLRQVIHQIQNYENARNESEQRRKFAELELADFIKAADEMKRKAEERVQQAESSAKHEEEARLASEKLMRDALQKLTAYEEEVFDAREAVEDAKRKLVRLENMEERCQNLDRELSQASEALKQAEERHELLLLEVESEKNRVIYEMECWHKQQAEKLNEANMILASEKMLLGEEVAYLNQSTREQSEKLDKIVKNERELRKITEDKLERLFKKYLEVDKLRNAESEARVIAEKKAKMALEQASKAVMHVLSSV